jgi:hypothetical protein
MGRTYLMALVVTIANHSIFTVILGKALAGTAGKHPRQQKVPPRIVQGVDQRKKPPEKSFLRRE